MSTIDLVTARARRDAVLAGYRDDESTARSLLLHPAASVRSSAYGALARGKYLNDDDLHTALNDPEPTVRRRACALAASRETVDLIPLLKDQDDGVVEMAAWALGEQGRSNCVDDLINLVYSHENALCRESAVAALGAIGDERGLPAILHATNDKPAVRRRAIISLAPFEGAEVTNALENAKTDRDWQVRQAAEDLLTIDLTDGGDEEDDKPGTPDPDDEWPVG